MKKTLVVSAFPGCGKTFLYENQDKAIFNICGKAVKLSFLDSDSSKFNKEDNWEKKYAQHIKDNIGKYDFIFISMHPGVFRELQNLGIKYVTIYPNNTDNISKNERMLIKQQWFGRFILRDNKHITDFNKWLNTIKNLYDDWTSINSILGTGSLAYYLLNQNQYISDILENLYILKEKL